MTDRRTFLTQAAGAASAAALGPGLPLPRAVEPRAPAPHAVARVERALARHPLADDAAALAEDEAFWAEVRAAYELEPRVVNLDHGWTNPTPRAALDAIAVNARSLEALPAERLVEMWETVTSTTVRAALAETMGVPPSELALVRNATEALDTVLLGVPLRAGDEVVCSAHDYYAMLDALDQRAARDGIVLRMVRPPVPAPSADALAALYEAAIGPKTRLVLLTHPSNLTGQLLPVRRIVAAARRVGAEVAVDGAQSLGLVPEPIRSLDCDYYGASCHKWLGTPVGLGVLWMKPEHAAKVWPLLPPGRVAQGMSRFEWIGTAPEFLNPAALPALELHRRLGPERKLARLRHLARRWRGAVARALPEATFSTRDADDAYLGLCTVRVPGVAALAVQRALRERHGILVQGMAENHRAPEIDAVRVTPNVYTSPGEVDRFVAAFVEVVRAAR